MEAEEAGRSEKAPEITKNSQNENSGGNKRKISETNNSGNSNKNNKKNKTCYNCGKKGHFKKECRSRKRQKKNAESSHNANVVEEDINDVIEYTSGNVKGNSNSFVPTWLILRCEKTNLPSVVKSNVAFSDTGGSSRLAVHTIVFSATPARKIPTAYPLPCWWNPKAYRPEGDSQDKFEPDVREEPGLILECLC
ncbi:hypothetical protein RJ640_022527 [Escallonia rubra]|uniref:CCHC-type domain-containing protein n=1 Tax=Escallonia rubra TaxID=112253 RepID=A0AA88RLM6_9ASTE|nr:hypothetical protein RJ640_022527 [Escallonia rubra]